MRLLHNECIPRKLKNSFQSHDCRSVIEEGWAGKKNGELLRLAENCGFQIFLTLDHGFEYQQKLSSRAMAVLLIRTDSNRLPDLLRHIPEILQVLSTIQPAHWPR
jgi:Domain of unknown function (DUF5615)